MDVATPEGNKTLIENGTAVRNTSKSDQEEFNWKNWVNYLILTCVLLLLATYITVVLALDVVASFRKKGRNPADKTSKKYGIYMRVTCLALSVSMFLHLADGIMEEVVVFFVAPELCAFSKCIKAITGSLAFLFSYLVMWFRQRSIYSNPAMRHLTNHCTRALSIIVVLLLVLSPVANTIVYVSCFKFQVVPSGCAIIGSTINPVTPWIVVGSTSLLMQLLLLGLFLLPLRKHQSSMGGKARRLQPIIRRAFVTSLACAVTDTVTSFLAASSVINDGMTIGISMQVSTFCNLIMVVVSFPDWRSTIFPCCCRGRNAGQRTTGSSTNEVQDGKRDTSTT